MRRSLACSLLVAVAVFAAACSDGEESGAPSSTTSSSSTTTTSVGDELCATLTEADYETRKAALADAADVVDEADCASLVEELEAAIALEQRAASLPPDSVELTLRCDDRTLFPTLVSRAEVPVGYAGALSRYPSGAADDPSRIGTGFVVWRIDAGATVETERGLGGSGLASCGTNGQIFLADDSGADASTPAEVTDDDGSSDEQASDDPEVWFPALIAAEREWQAAGDPAGVARTEDLRSLGYADLVESAPDGPSPRFDRPATYTVCIPYEGPDEDHIGLLYRVDHGAFSYTDDDGSTVDLPAETTTRFGAFRRGADGRWRWLVGAVTVQSKGCSSPRELLVQLLDSGLVELPDGVTLEDVETMPRSELSALVEELGGSRP